MLWFCSICQKNFPSKIEMLRHFHFLHKEEKIWYNKKHAKLIHVSKRFNPSRRDSYKTEFIETDSPGNEISRENYGIVYKD